ncbi:glycosyltransferase involved in cell wall biosynthesis [Sphingomonas sp. BK036]|nr:glycosyltransferase involved in cell wall biosynthesis [Sphingomonas sp. BK036]
MTMRVLILAHGYPAFSTGGGEQAAHALYARLLERDDVAPVLVARAPRSAIGHDASFGAFQGSPTEILADPPKQDHFSLESTQFAVLEAMVGQLLERFRPDLVHIEHLAYWSIDIVELLARAGVPIVLTLHEFLLICHHDGQMIKTDGRLCSAESPAACAACFPHHSAGEFYLRKRMILQRLAPIARFVSPSAFLADRFVAWGLDRARITVIDNPLSPDVIAQGNAPDRGVADDENRPAIRVGFFGQVNPYKGLDVLLGAVSQIPKPLRASLSVGIHGANFDAQGGNFRAKIAALLEANADVVANEGRYANGDVVALMRQYDWIVVPSIWWENSPVVIQEALVARRPILCSAIGGMAERVAQGVGVTFQPGSAVDLARTLVAIITGRIVAPDMTAAYAPDAEEARVSQYVSLFATALAAGHAPAE